MAEKRVGNPEPRNMVSAKLATNEIRALTNDNALTELAVWSSLSGRFCDAGCNTTALLCVKSAGCSTNAVHKHEMPRREAERHWSSCYQTGTKNLPYFLAM